MKMVGSWSAEQNKFFEEALALFNEDSVDRWQNIANYVPDKTAEEVRRHYEILLEDVQAIESGLVSLPQYSESSYVPDWLSEPQPEPSTTTSSSPSHVSARSPSHSNFSFKANSNPSKSFEQERKKGVPWTEEEHRLFLLGLNKYGKGDWRSISRNFVVSRTPTQVASHAQKYFLRLSSANKEKKRSSIHDITSAGVTDIKQQSPVQQTSSFNNNPATTPTSSAPSLGYSSLGATVTNPVSSQMNSSLMQLSSHTLGSYPPHSFEPQSSRHIASTGPFCVPQGEQSENHDAYYVGNLMSME
eukprot:TRINITY_DN2626_c0_g1_i1.p1 TRINITY_DN2626_c0_g1~~TRINITY_DN2626_c0_g1_i1.p1  ORF type:complete len:301 (+),score=40.97 TRINITY_DN2626_c0_g1_i1:587-1489(+)